jgi:mRNA interferase MazF
MVKLQRPLRSVTSSDKGVYCPDAGDIIKINFDPQAGREQAGPRPALVLSPRLYNEKARLCVLCPITSHVKRYPFEVLLPDGHQVKGAVLSDHVKSLSWESRNSQFLCVAPNGLAEDVKAKIRALLQF